MESRVYVLHDENGPIWLKQANRYGAPRPSKRVYFRKGDAKSGIHHLPSCINKSNVRIVEYAPVDNKWSLLKQYLLRMREENKYIPDYRWANGDALDMMELLERGEELLE